jgi:hypothetical protein
VLHESVTLGWSNPHNIALTEGKVLLYFIGVTDGNGIKHGYIGQTRNGARGLQEYQKALRKIAAGKPRQSAAGKEKYRAVHLALAKACEHGWPMEFYPLENVGAAMLEKVEQKRRAELGSDLNAGRSWRVEDYSRLTLAELL